MSAVETYLKRRSVDELIQIGEGYDFWRETKSLHPTDDYFGMHTQEVYGDTRASSLVAMALMTWRELATRLLEEGIPSAAQREADEYASLEYNERTCS